MSTYTRSAVAGAAAVGALVAIVAVTVGLFRGSFTTAIPVTVISDRAGLVMNPGAKVKMRDVQVGTVSSIQTRPDGKAVLQLAIDPSKGAMIPSNVAVDIAATTVFGAKYVDLVPSAQPSPQALRPGQVIVGQHVTVEANTVFERLTSVLSTIRPEDLNQTLTALATGFGGRGQQLGATINDLETTLRELEPHYPTLGADIGMAPGVLNTYADASPDLLQIIGNASTISRTIVSEQNNLDILMVSLIGFADTATDVIGANRQGLTDVLRLLSPITGLTNQYNPALYCLLTASVQAANMPPMKVPGAEVMASFQWGADPYRFPSDLPKVAAKGGPQCVGLPNLPFETRPPYVVADTGTNPWEYGNRGIVWNTAAMKQFLLGEPLDGVPRNITQIGQPG